MKPFLGLFNGSNEVNPDDSFDGSNYVFTVGLNMGVLLGFFNGSNEVKPDDSFDGLIDGYTMGS